MSRTVRVEGQALQQFAEAAYPLISVVGTVLDQTGTGTSWRQPSRRSRGDRRRPCHSSTGTSTPTAGSDGRRVAEPQDRGSADRRDRDHLRDVTSRRASSPTGRYRKVRSGTAPSSRPRRNASGSSARRSQTSPAARPRNCIPGESWSCWTYALHPQTPNHAAPIDPLWRSGGVVRSSRECK